MKSHVTKVIMDLFLNVLEPKFYKGCLWTFSKFKQNLARTLIEKSFKDKHFTVSKVFIIIMGEPLSSLRWWERAQAQWGTPAGTPAGTLGPKKGWLWRSTSPGNEDVLICINAQFMTQRVLKPWWQWTYQNSAVKRAAARAIPGWVTSWEVWVYV
jgi:hypothetical protein